MLGFVQIKSQHLFDSDFKCRNNLIKYERLYDAIFFYKSMSKSTSIVKLSTLSVNPIQPMIIDIQKLNV